MAFCGIVRIVSKLSKLLSWAVPDWAFLLPTLSRGVPHEILHDLTPCYEEIANRFENLIGEHWLRLFTNGDDRGRATNNDVVVSSA